MWHFVVFNAVPRFSISFNSDDICHWICRYVVKSSKNAENRWFWGPILGGEDTPSFGHTFSNMAHFHTSNVIDWHRGPKWKLRCGYRARSLQRMSCLLLSSVVLRAFSALCMYSTFGHHPHPLDYLCAQFCFFCSLHCWASPWRKIMYSLTHPAYLMPQELEHQVIPNQYAVLSEKYWPQHNAQINAFAQVSNLNHM